MKKIIFLIAFSIIAIFQAVAQEYEYVPFVRESVKWVYYYVNEFETEQSHLPRGTFYYILEFKGDTIINGKSYKCLHKYSGNSSSSNDTIPVYMREDNKVVYSIVPDGKRYVDCPIGNHISNPYNGQEFVLYDFNDPIGFCEANFTRPEYDYYPYTFEYIDTLTTSSGTLKRYIGRLFDVFNIYLIEGIGFDGYDIGYTLELIIGEPADAVFHLSHVVENGKIIYKGVNYDPDNMTGIDEVVADRRGHFLDPNYYNMMGQPVGTEVPTAPGIYIHQGKKICVSPMP